MRTQTWLGIACLAVLVAALPRSADATEEATPSPGPLRLNPFSRLGTSLKASYWGANALLHLGGIAATPVLIASGVDTQVHNFYVQYNQFSPYTVPGVVGGYFAPLLLGAGLAGYGWLAEGSRPTQAANAVLQSLLISFTYQAVLKTVTGRKAPASIHYDDDSASRQFQLGFLRNGIDWGWPSGLLMTNAAAVVSLAYVYRESWLLRIAGAAYLGYLFISAPAHEDAKLCWFSDAVAGLAMGIAIGRGVGGSLTGPAPGHLDRISLLPMVSPAGKGVAASFRF